MTRKRSHDEMMDFSNDMVALVVGPEKRELFVHRTHLTNASGFFRAAFRDGTWKEAKEKTMELPKDDPDTFQFFLHWIYTRELPCTDPPPKPYLGLEITQCMWYMTPAKLYCLADKFQDIRLKNDVMDAMVQMSETRDNNGARLIPNAAVTTYVYAHTSENALIRDFILALYLRGVLGILLNTSFPPQFLATLASRLSIRALLHRPATEETVDSADYHETMNDCDAPPFASRDRRKGMAGQYRELLE